MPTQVTAVDQQLRTVGALGSVVGCCPGCAGAATNVAPDGVAAEAPLAATMQQAGASQWLMGFPTLPSAPRPAPDRALPAVLQQRAPVAVPYHGYPEDGEAVTEVLTTQAMPLTPPCPTPLIPPGLLRTPASSLPRPATRTGRVRVVWYM